MKILYWAQKYAPWVGGIELTAQWSMRDLVREGHCFLVVTSSDDGETRIDREDGIEIHRLPFLQVITERDPFLLLELNSKVAALKRKFRADLVHVALNDPSPIVHLATEKAHPSPLIVSLHGQVPAGLGEAGTLTGKILEKSRLILGVGQHLLDEVSRRSPELAEKCRLLPNARRFSEAPLLNVNRAPNLIAVGRFEHQKNTAAVLHALPKILRASPETRLTLVGDGQERASLERLCEELHLSEAVTFTGLLPQERVSELLSEHAILLLASHYEGQPGVAIEAAFAGLPVVASRVAGTDEVVVDGVTGLLVVPDSPPAMARAVIDLLADESRRQEMGQAARERALAEFSWSSRLRRLEQFYREAL